MFAYMHIWQYLVYVAPLLETYQKMLPSPDLAQQLHVGPTVRPNKMAFNGRLYLRKHQNRIK